MTNKYIWEKLYQVVSPYFTTDNHTKEDCLLCSHVLSRVIKEHTQEELFERINSFLQKLNEDGSIHATVYKANKSKINELFNELFDIYLEAEFNRRLSKLSASDLKELLKKRM